MNYDELSSFIIENTRCEYCFADYDEWCVTKSGARTHYLHQVRQWPIREAASRGYMEGVDDGRRWEREEWQRKLSGRVETLYAGQGEPVV